MNNKNISQNEKTPVPERPAPLPADGNTPAEGLFSDLGFDSFGLSSQILESISVMGYQLATPVQAECIPLALEGTDLIVRSKTGTGKTAAFGIPVAEKAGTDTSPSAIVLTPTRELALQCADEIRAIGSSRGVRVCAVYGGTSMEKQIKDLQSGVDVVVGTPGRILDQLKRRHLDLSKIKQKVLDEADEMLSMGFFEDVCTILDSCPGESQTLLFSATVSEDVESLIRNYAKEPKTILLSGDEYSVEGIENILYETRDDCPKPRNLLYLIDMENPHSAIVFCNTRDDTTLVSAVLNRHGHQAAVLNSDLSQRERERVMASVKQGNLRFMIATDLAARGIDISGLTHVLNYSLPEEPLVYMHRVGRTGRIGNAGRAISLMGGRDLSTLSVLEKRYGVVFERRKLPDEEEARRNWTKRHINELREGMGASVFEAFLPLVQDIKKMRDGDFILAHALKTYFDSRRPAAKQEKAGRMKPKGSASMDKPGSSGRKRARGRSRRSPRKK